MSPLLSIVIPVYNSEQFLVRCINSILDQSYTDYELILINDGSTDKSLEICKRYSNITNKITIINQENKGVSAARNTGVCYSKGEWVAFVDSDDWVEKGWLEECATIIAKYTNVDIIRWGYFKESSEKTFSLISDQDYYIQNKEEMLQIISNCAYYGFLWNTLFRRDVISNIRFNENLSWCEDQIFTYEAILHSQYMYVSSKPFYHYNVSSNGLSNIKDPRMIISAAEEEYTILCQMSDSRNIIVGYYNKLMQAIKLLYCSSESLRNRYRFYVNAQSIEKSHMPFLLRMYFFKIIPFIFKDLVLILRFRGF